MSEKMVKNQILKNEMIADLKNQKVIEIKNEVKNERIDEKSREMKMIKIDEMVKVVNQHKTTNQIKSLDLEILVVMDHDESKKQHHLLINLPHNSRQN